MDDVSGRSLLEVGSRDVNGSVRSVLENLRPATYVGVDRLPGPGVDVVCDATDLVARFGPASFDLVVSTELLEHVSHWRDVVSNLKNVLKPDGVLLVTTRSRGFPFHCPGDFWRYEESDLRSIFADLSIERLERDHASTPGVFMRARKPSPFKEVDLDGFQLYSVVRRKRVTDISPAEVALMNVATTSWQGCKAVLPENAVNFMRKLHWRTSSRP